MQRRVCGIDVGFTGSAALFGYPDGAVSNRPRVLDVYDFKAIGDAGAKRIDILSFRDWLLVSRISLAYIENANAMPSIPDKTGKRRGMGAGTSARYMRCAGHIEATVACCGIDVVMVSPSPWKRALGLVGPNKGNSISLALELCPEARKWLPSKVRKGVATDVQKFHNRAEAVLIAIYGAARADMIDLKPMD